MTKTCKIQMNLHIHEMYASIQGEADFAGRPCFFVRTTGCDLRCHWCDTPQAFSGGQRMSIESILAAIRASGLKLVQLTGGEPLLQKNMPALVDILVSEGYQPIVETGGHIGFASLNPQAFVVADVKMPGSGEQASRFEENFAVKRKNLSLKHVILDHDDFRYAMDFIRSHEPMQQNPHWLSPVAGKLDPQLLVEWMLAENSPFDLRLNLQLHKIIWGADAQGV